MLSRYDILYQTSQQLDAWTCLCMYVCIVYSLPLLFLYIVTVMYCCRVSMSYFSRNRRVICPYPYHTRVHCLCSMLPSCMFVIQCEHQYIKLTADNILLQDMMHLAISLPSNMDADHLNKNHVSKESWVSVVMRYEQGIRSGRYGGRNSVTSSWTPLIEPIRAHRKRRSLSG